MSEIMEFTILLTPTLALLIYNITATWKLKLLSIKGVYDAIYKSIKNYQK